MPTVVISHSSLDDDAVTALAGELTAAGISVWVDHLKGITPGDRFHKAIQEAVTAADAGLFILSPDSADSAYCEAEWTRVLDLKKTLYVALLRTLPTANIPLRLGTIHRVDLIRDRAAAVKALTEAILGGREMERADAAETAHISGSFPASQLDLPLIGREREFQAVQESLQTQRVTAILGLGGVGKTRLAAEIARTSRAPGGMVWHTIQPYTTIEQLTLAVRDHLRLPLTAEDEAIWAAAGARGVLIVLDNAEACAAPAAYAERVNRLDTTQGARALLTSRAAWRELRGVKAFDLAAPDLPSAEAILKAMLAAEPPIFPADGHERELAEAARRHPRLMLYAVGWLNTYPIAAVLETTRTLKGADAEEALDDLIHKTVRQMEAQPGGAEAKAALRRLAVCRGGFTLEAAKAIIGDEAGALGPLMRWRLVTSDGRRYSIDPLVIEAAGEDETAHRPHYAFYRALAQEHDRKQDYLGLDPESANLEAAFEWAMRIEQFADALYMANACGKFLANRGRFSQNMDWFERLAAVITPHPDPMAYADAQNSLGVTHQEYPLGDRLVNL
ncbi:MAG: toll/interleukin-1 receptor domain-containing protein, partial [Anaerolineae bacterium]|nr:toll/interleukin-1 receptor domain-containing protein [Anaerolineae bacterium]